MVARLGSSIMQPPILLVVAGWMPLVCLCSCTPHSAETTSAGGEPSAQFDETNPVGANAACYVCHMTFVKEELSKTHLQAEITCIRCHGLSAAHANDEDIGATPPDIAFARDHVDAMCLECHERHDISSEMAARWQRRDVCTDCHGAHRITKIEVIREPAEHNPQEGVRLCSR